jgi:hypothetical protein
VKNTEGAITYNELWAPARSTSTNGYIPLPPDFQSKVSSAIDAIT